MRTPTEPGLYIQDGLNALYRESGDLQSVIGQYDYVMADHACFLSGMGVSWRNFYVGGCAVLLEVDEWAHDLSNDELMTLDRPAGRITFLEGANYSPYEGSPRNCPELTFAEWGDEIARECGRAIMPHVYTRGPSDPLEIATSAGTPLNTLLFCYTCGPAMTKCSTSWENMRITTQALDTRLGYYFKEDFTLSTMNARLSQLRPPLSSLDRIASENSTVNNFPLLAAAR